MSMDLIISDKGDIMIAGNAPFRAPVSRVDFDLSRKILVMNYDESAESDVLNVEVHDRMMAGLTEASSVFILHFNGGNAVEGFRVPLVRLEL